MTYTTTNGFDFEKRSFQIERGSSFSEPPSNNGELIIIISGSISVTILGKARSLNIDQDEAYIFNLRNRGMIISALADCQMDIVRIPPMYTQIFIQNLSEQFTGIYRVEKGSDPFSSEHFFKDLQNTFSLLKLHSDCNTMLNDCLNQINLSNGNITVKELHESVGVSKSTLVQQFSKNIGVTPKEYCRIEKLNYFLDSYKSKPDYSLTELAYHCGYYDQSHLIKDFQYFLNTSPKKYLMSANLS